MYIVAHNGAHLWGGAERGTTRILAGLQERGHRVLLFCNDPMVAERAGDMGVPAEVFRLGGDIAVHHAWRFARILRRERLDVLLLGTFKKTWLGALAGKLAGVPRIVLRIGLETDLPRNAKYRWVIPRWVDTVVLKADDVRPRWQGALPELGPERLVTVLGGVERPPRTGPPGMLRASLGIDPDAPIIGAVARLAVQKRFDRLIHSLAALPEEVQCVLAGEGEERGALEVLAAELGVRHRLHFLGHREDVGNVLDALDLFVVSSDREMLCFAMLEALAAGIPVVSTPVSGAEEALEPFPNGNAPGAIVGFAPKEIAAVVERLLSDPQRLREMRVAAARRVAERFTLERMIERWERVLSDVPAPALAASRAKTGENPAP